MRKSSPTSKHQVNSKR